MNYKNTRIQNISFILNMKEKDITYITIELKKNYKN